MSSTHVTGSLALLFALASFAAAPAAQSAPGVAVLTADGRVLEAELVGLDAAEIALRPAAGDGAGGIEKLDRDRVVAIAGARPRVVGEVRVELVGGDVLRGRLAAGDELGDTFAIDSPVFGRLVLPVDRLRRAVFEPRATGAGPRVFELPAGVDFGEAVFRRAARGFDRTLGAIVRFGGEAVEFAREGSDDARAFPYAELAAIVVAGGFPREEPAAAVVSTRVGDRLRVDEIAFADGAWRLVLEGGREVELAAVDIAAVSLAGDALTRLSDLPVTASREHALAGEDVAPLWPFRRRGEVASGGPLRSGGRGFADGIGVHAFSELRFTVPDGVSALVGMVGIDDVVLELGVRGAAAVAVLVDGSPAWSVPAVRVGQAPLGIGRIVVRPGQTVALRADFGPGFDLGDRVDWLEVAFVR